jgi:hypothetical protein
LSKSKKILLKKFENIDTENESTLSIWSYELIIKWPKKGLKVKLAA